MIFPAFPTTCDSYLVSSWTILTSYHLMLVSAKIERKCVQFVFVLDQGSPLFSHIELKYIEGI